jgi:hypothetical protein
VPAALIESAAFRSTTPLPTAAHPVILRSIVDESTPSFRAEQAHAFSPHNAAHPAAPPFTACRCPPRHSERNRPTLLLFTTTPTSQPLRSPPSPPIPQPLRVRRSAAHPVIQSETGRRFFFRVRFLRTRRPVQRRISLGFRLGLALSPKNLSWVSPWASPVAEESLLGFVLD